MAHPLSPYPTDLLLTILSKMDRVSFLRLSRSCKWIHEIIKEGQEHIKNCVINEKIKITIHRPSRERDSGYYMRQWRRRMGQVQEEEKEEVVFPPYYKLTIGSQPQKTAGFELFEDFCMMMKQFKGLRLAEMTILTIRYDDASDLVAFLRCNRITCEKLTVIFPQEKATFPPDLIDTLKPLKLVILPTSLDRDLIQWNVDHFVPNIDHLSLLVAREEILGNTLKSPELLKKTSLSIHFINNYIEHDDIPQFEEAYSYLHNFYKRFITSTKCKLKDFQIYCQDAREKPGDPHFGCADDANDLLLDITGYRKWREQSPSPPWDHPDLPEPVYMADPSNPDGELIKGNFNLDDAPTTYYKADDPHRRGYYNDGSTRKRSILLKRYMPFVDGFHHKRMVISITEGRKRGEYILTLFGDSSKGHKIYFAIAVLTDWASYQRFLGLMDARSYNFPMSDIEPAVMQLLFAF